MAKTYRDIPALTAQEQERFWSKIDKTPGYGPDGDCWKWMQSTEKDGYARLILKRPNGDWRHLLAHRISYFLHHGFIDNTLCVCHSCDNRSCVNPAHLWQGTPLENSTDMTRKNRSAHNERNGGARLNSEQVREIRELLDSGITGRSLARRFNVAESTISWIRKRGTWKRLS
jgi:hypothetical protein